MRKAFATLLLFGLGTAAPLHAANQTECTIGEEQFLEQLKGMSTWPAIYSVYNSNLPTCPDDGFFGEGYSDVVVVALAKHWSSLKKLEQLGAKDPAFQVWVLSHIDATTSESDLQRVVRNARTKCADGSKALCSEIAKRAEHAIASM